MGKDVEWGGASQHAERGYHANKTEAVVAMKVGDEYMSQFRKPDF